MITIAAHRHTIGTGVASGLDALHRMRGIIVCNYVDPVVRHTGAVICRDTGMDSVYQVHLIRRWLQSNVGFLRDPIGHELLHTPQLLLAMLNTDHALDVDCDDVAILAASLGMSIGLRARCCMIGQPGGYEHVWAELSDPVVDEWVDLDITRPYQVDMNQYPLTLTIEV